MELATKPTPWRGILFTAALALPLAVIAADETFLPDLVGWSDRVPTLDVPLINGGDDDESIAWINLIALLVYSALAFRQLAVKVSPWAGRWLGIAELAKKQRERQSLQGTLFADRGNGETSVEPALRQPLVQQNQET